MAKITFVFFYPHIKFSRFTNHTVQVLQSANIMNWHKLVYTFHFLDDKNNQKACFFLFVFVVFLLCPVRLHFHDAQARRLLMLHSHWTVTPDFIAATLPTNHNIC